MISKLIDPVLMIFVSRFEDDDGDAMVEESVFPLFEFCDCCCCCCGCEPFKVCIEEEFEASEYEFCERDDDDAVWL